jgi:hypothetical protein
MRWLAAVGVMLATGVLVSGAGAVEYARVCSLYGYGWYYEPGTDSCLNVFTGETRTQTAFGTKRDVNSLTARVGVLEGQTVQLQQSYSALQGRFDADFRSANAGSAAATALQDPDLIGTERFGVKVNWGSYLDANAVGASFAGVIGQNRGLRTTVSGGIATTGSDASGHAGVQFSW